jgi:stearoyl-CoA desaturase (Delta-9 desaturase)
MRRATSFNNKYTLTTINSFFESHAIYAISFNVLLTLYFFILDFSINTLLIASIWTLFITIVIDIMYHRYYAHKSFSFKNDTIRKILSILTIFGGYGSYITWTAVHRCHHIFSDTDKDPHGPNNHSLKDHLLLNFTIPQNVYKYATDLLRDPFNKTLHKSYWLIYLPALFILSLIDIHLAFVMFAFPTTVNLLNSYLSTYTLHTKIPGNYKSDGSKDNSYNNRIINILTLGLNGLHNNHHKDPSNYNFARTKSEFDLSAYFIKPLTDTND